MTDEAVRYTSATEIVALYGVPPATVYRLACTENWRRVNDNRRPALYHAADVRETFERRLAARLLDT